MTKIIALDFDGVICDGLAEYFHSSHLAYQKIWTETLNDATDTQGKFNQLRPLVETGWEMPVMLRAINLGYGIEEIKMNWRRICQDILKTENLDYIAISKTLDQVRQYQIDHNLDQWLSLHNFFPNTINTIQQLLNKENIKLFIITTKEGLFVKQLLINNGINLEKLVIIGKEVKRPKYESLRLIIDEQNEKKAPVTFIEDRLEALEAVKQQPDLRGVKLFLADWGYNTEETRAKVANLTDINLLSLNEFNSCQWI